ncbi:cell division protein FtsQ [Pedobacter sp. Du54]|uniref:cell division protein FtsQ/DivIB n=1 Tax=Pedobacter anseongensis TaxID=3133439 RepID=UPI0030A4698C
MLKRINWKAIGKGCAWAICLSGIIVLMSFIEIKKQEVKCTNVKIIIPGADNFIEREEIDAILEQNQGNLVGKSLEDINTHEIEAALKSNPYIAYAKVYADMDGVINILVKQRQPVLRIINAGGQDYYIDRDGLKMPMSPNFTANVLVATGNIFEGFSGRIDTLISPLVADLYKTALFLKQDTLWDSQIEQIFVNGKNDIELIPRVGNQRIILGNADSLAVKMSNLLAFYKQAMPQVGWDAYKTINVKYINQIVCEKNAYDSTAVKKHVVIDSALVVKQLIDSAVKTTIKEEVKTAAVVKIDAEKTTVKKVIPPSPTPKESKSAVTDKSAVTSKPIVAGEPKKTATKEVTTKERKDSTTPSTLYKPPAKPAPEKAKTPVVKKEKTDTKNPK